jgi:choline dehydrogenase-like flavoprotein
MIQANGSVDETRTYDALVIGAGLCGIIFLAYAREKGLSCLALEKGGDVGGIWSRLPAWQDIQNRRQDIALDGVPLDGVDQPAVHRYAREWVRRFDLDSCIRFRSEVTRVSRTNGAWTVHTRRGAFRAHYLIVASGVQNEPWVPDLQRSDCAIVETHSSELHEPESLAGERVTVVGGGASGWDLLDQAIEHGASEIHWVHRTVRWFLPTWARKQRAWPNLRELALLQSVARPPGVSAFMRWQLKLRYSLQRVTELVPAEPFDFGKHQLIPGRYSVIRNLEGISRHAGEIAHMRGRQITLTNGQRFDTDRVLWGTGYRMNLRYLGLPEYRDVRALGDLRPRLGSLVRSLDYPNLFFPGMALIDSTSSTPFLAAVEAKSIVAHIRGDCEIPETNIPYLLAYWDLIRYFASFDRANYPAYRWRIKYLWLAVWYAALRYSSVRV